MRNRYIKCFFAREGNIIRHHLKYHNVASASLGHVSQTGKSTQVAGWRIISAPHRTTTPFTEMYWPFHEQWRYKNDTLKYKCLFCYLKWF